VRVGGGEVPAELLCERGGELIYLQARGAGAELHRLGRADGGGQESLALGPEVGEQQEDCGAGTCAREYERSTPDGGTTFRFDERRSNYYGAWAPETRISGGGGARAWRASCPGQRPLLLCFTARRTVQVVIAGDPNDEPPTFVVDYLASDLGPHPKETLHLTRGEVVKSGTGYQATFANKGFSYRLQASVDPAAPGATLSVEKDGKALQTETCLAYSAFPAHLDWAAHR